MTINEAILYADRAMPNTYSEQQKTRWLAELDGKIEREIYKTEELEEYQYPKDGDKELLVAYPHSDIYPLYIYAMIDFHNREYGEYNNSILAFNQAYDLFAKWYIRNNIPKHSGGFTNII